MRAEAGRVGDRRQALSRVEDALQRLAKTVADEQPVNGKTGDRRDLSAQVKGRAMHRAPDAGEREPLMERPTEDLIHSGGVLQRSRPGRSREARDASGFAGASSAGVHQRGTEKPVRRLLLLHRVGARGRRAERQAVKEILADRDRGVRQGKPWALAVALARVQHTQHLPDAVRGGPEDRAGIASGHGMTEPVDLARGGERQRARGDERRGSVHLPDERPPANDDDFVRVDRLFLVRGGVTARTAPVEESDVLAPEQRSKGRSGRRRILEAPAGGRRQIGGHGHPGFSSGNRRRRGGAPPRRAGARPRHPPRTGRGADGDRSRALFPVQR